MSDANKRLNKLTLALWLMVVGCLSVASLGGVFDTPLMAYFWYLALAGMAAMLLLMVLLAFGWIWHAIVHRYRRLRMHPAA